MNDIQDPFVIETKYLSKTVKNGDEKLTILKDINFNIKPGEIVAIRGISGSGKTTLLGLLAGLDLPTSGEIWLAGQEITQLNEDARALLRAKNVGFIFQSFHLLPSLTALENVMLPLELLNSKSAHKQAEDYLYKVGLAERKYHYPRQLSGGEQQRVAIARAFAIQPKILFADEITANLDPYTSAKIVNLLFELNTAQGTTLVLVTHDNELAQRCPRILELINGQMVI